MKRGNKNNYILEMNKFVLLFSISSVSYNK